MVRGPMGNLCRNGFWFLLGLKWFLMRLGVSEWGVMWSDVDGGLLGNWWWLQWICGGELAEEIGGGYGMRKKDV